jgi:hypothetical protein
MKWVRSYNRTARATAGAAGWSRGFRRSARRDMGAASSAADRGPIVADRAPRVSELLAEGWEGPRSPSRLVVGASGLKLKRLELLFRAGSKLPSW